MSAEPDLAAALAQISRAAQQVAEAYAVAGRRLVAAIEDAFPRAFLPGLQRLALASDQVAARRLGEVVCSSSHDELAGACGSCRAQL